MGKAKVLSWRDLEEPSEWSCLLPTHFQGGVYKNGCLVKHGVSQQRIAGPKKAYICNVIKFCEVGKEQEFKIPLGK
jgi:hypothetical protein